MKRFWKEAAVVSGPGGWGIALDGKAVRTPARAQLAVPSEALAAAIAAEWNDAAEVADPRAMPLTGLANAAIDRVAPDPETFARGLAAYGETDLLCYRAASPEALVRRQEAEWGPLLALARRAYDVDFAVTEGVSHVAQPPATLARLAHEVAARDVFQLAGLAPLVAIGGSLIAALAVAEGAVSPDQGWSAVSLDDRWQCETWGEDFEAKKALDGRERDFFAAARFLDLLG